ncbi:MAG TPA: Gfo/Idh/MocA family oxidoreductase [Candidatus Methylomirabilis sp.]|nr:Gfo/Idh/MocA family oxidoreductase [Candidatus Methylomirabilis sp.]
MTLSPSPEVRPIRLGIIGTGLAVRKLHWPALARLSDRFVVAAFANRTRATGEEFAALAKLSMADYCSDYHDLLRRDDVEAVLNCVPIPQLLPITRDCLAAGKHVMCEKPPGVDLAEARQFLALVDEYPRQKFMMTENFFYRDDLRLARSLLDAGAIGKPQLLLERWVCQLVPTPGEYSITPWRYKPEYRGGPLLDGGVHSIATIRLLGGDLTHLCARTEWINRTMDAPSVLTMTFGLAGGGSGNCVWGFLGNPVLDESRDTRLYGSEGALISSDGRARLVRADGSTEEHRVEQADRGHYNMFLNFHDALVHGEPIVATVRQGFENMLVVLQALESAEQGRPAEVAAAPKESGVLRTGVSPWAGGVPLWRPRGASGLFEGLPCQVRRIPAQRG